MFSYEQNDGRPILFESNYSPKQTKTAELKNGTLFIYAFPKEENSILVITFFNNDIHGYEYIVSSVALKLKKHDFQSKIDIYEFE